MFNWEKVFARRNWENKPSQKTPLSASNLNSGDYAINELDNRVIALNTAKFDRTDAQGLFKDVSLDKKTGVITFTLVNGSTKTLDTLLEKIAVNFAFDEETQQLVITLDDGTVKKIDMSALITQYEFLDSDTIAFVLEGGKVKAIVKEGSISEKHLRTDYLAEIKVQSAGAASSAASAASSANDADYDAKLAQSYSVGGSGIRENEDEDNARFYKEQAALSATEAIQSASGAAESEEKSALNAGRAESSATDAIAGKKEAAQSALSAAEAAQSAAGAAAGAKSEAEAAAVSAKAAENAKAEASESAAGAKESKGSSESAALLSQSYAVGGTGSREGENTDCAKYYYEHTKEISGADNYLLKSQVGAALGVAGLDENGFVPASQLPSFVDDVIEGQYINSTEFVGTDGVVIVPESGKVYVDVSAGNITSGRTYRWSGTRYVVIGSDLALGETSSTAFRGDYGKVAYDHSRQTGNPHGTTAADVGLGNVPNVATNEQRPTFTQADSRANIVSNEKMTTIFGKIAKWFNDLKNVAFTGSYKDLIDKPSVDTALSTASTNAVQNKAVASIIYGDEISTNDDWDNITIGYHVVNGGSQYPWSADKHAPVGAWGWGYVIAWVYGTCGYQIYITASSRKMYIRSRYGSNWTGWGEYDKIDAAFDGAIDVSAYTSASPYTTQSDGYLTMTINGYAGQYLQMSMRDKNGTEVDEIIFPDGSNGYGCSRNVYVPKGMRVYKKAGNLVTGGISSAVFRPFNRT